MPWPSSAVNSGPRRLSQAHGITETCRNSQPTCSAASCSSPADRPDVQSQAKTLRGSFDHLNDRKAVHVLSAFASDAALILAHQELAGAPDEIAAVPRLMAELGVTGVLFTADALHCQKDGFAQAAATSNALLVRIKENQPTLSVCDPGRALRRAATLRQLRDRGPRPAWPPGASPR